MESPGLTRKKSVRPIKFKKYYNINETKLLLYRYTNLFTFELTGSFFSISFLLLKVDFLRKKSLPWSLLIHI